MECPNCIKLRRKLSPLEDQDFTADFLLMQPVAWMREHTAFRKNSTVQIVSISAAECYEQAFGIAPNINGSMKMGRTLRALGWEPTKQNGLTRYVMDLEEFDNEHFPS